MDLTTRKKMNAGYADTLSRGFEFALVPVVFGGMGWLLDRWLDTSPLFTIGLVVFGFIGQFVKMWLGYDAAMKAEEEGAVWNRHKTAPAGTARSEGGES